MGARCLDLLVQLQRDEGWRPSREDVLETGGSGYQDYRSLRGGEDHTCGSKQTEYSKGTPGFDKREADCPGLIHRRLDLRYDPHRFRERRGPLPT